MNGIVDKLLLSLIVAVAVLLPACMGHAQSGRNQSGTTPPDKVPGAVTTEAAFPRAQSVPMSALDKEAEQAAEAFLKHTYYKCRDSYFMYLQVQNWPAPASSPVYLEIKGFAWKVEGKEVIPPPLTEAERLNGVKRPQGEWLGTVSVIATAYREHHGKWSAWEDVSGPWGQKVSPGTGVMITFPLTKLAARNLASDQVLRPFRFGKWAVEDPESRHFSVRAITPVDCNAIPQASLKVSEVPDPKPPKSKNPAKPVPATLVADPLLVPPDAVPKKSP